ncbi:hypothetical protein [Ramlibacter alkalitolerans]|uniref:Uncharacterized protein n=1 Tax=Ramlibacter alkalitolerans TaxID=2039631 RepID=A0ABS1JWP3_9BURK|nr:hypothetical protein [Ramlibacter alkalitolerans]MBL0428738.1 hypothetical protein [Ramlibacter alkalitolerans]
MRAKVITMRKGGRNLHRDELSQLPPIVGELRIKEEHDRALHRHLVRARLLDISKGTEHDLLPSLTDARLIQAVDGKMTLIGTERVDHAEFGQTWAVELT